MSDTDDGDDGEPPEDYPSINESILYKLTGRTLEKNTRSRSSHFITAATYRRDLQPRLDASQASSPVRRR